MKPKDIDPTFGTRLKKLMRDAEMSNADLSRIMFGETTETRPDGSVYKVAKNRQSIGRYISGKTYPSEETRVKIADAIGVAYSELFPNEGPPEQRVGSGVSLVQVNKRDSRIDVHVVLPTEEAMKVLAIVSSYCR